MGRKREAVKVRAWKEEDIPAIVACHRAAYPDYLEESIYDERIYHMQFTAFPQGQLLAEVDGQVVGYATQIWDISLTVFLRFQNRR